MLRDEVVTEVNKVLHEGFEIPFEKLSPTAHLFSDLELDSLDAIDLMVALEERTGAKVNIEVFKSARTMGDVYRMVGDLVEGRKDGPQSEQQNAPSTTVDQ